MGTVVHVYRDGQAYEVEFVALDNQIDNLVHEPNELTPAEIALVEGGAA